MATFSETGLQVKKIMDEEIRVANRLLLLEKIYKEECLLEEVAFSEKIAKITDKHSLPIKALQEEADALRLAREELQCDLMRISEAEGTDMLVIEEDL